MVAIYCIRTTNMLFESKLIITAIKKSTIAIKYTMFKDFGNNWTDRNPTKIIHSYCLTIRIALLLFNKGTV